MNAKVDALWRLLQRPALLFWIPAIWIASAALSSNLTETLSSSAAAAEVFRLQLLRGLYLFCVTAGLAVGQAVQEAQHSPLSFTLPGLRRGFRYGTVLVGLAAVGLTLAAHLWLLSPPTAALALLNLLGFGLGLVLFDPLGSLGLALLHALALLWSIAGLEGLIGLADRFPLAALPLGGAILLWWARRALGDAAFRSKPFVPNLALISIFSLPVEKRYHQERLRHSSLSKRLWPAKAIGKSTWRWVQAAVYGAAGFRRLGWAGWTASYSLILLLLVLGFSILEGFAQGGGIAQGLEFAYRLLAYTSRTDPLPSGQGVDYWSLPWYAGAVWTALCCGSPVFMRTKKVYPLSRRDLGRVACWTGLLHLGVLSASTALVLGLALALLALQTGYPLPSGALPHLAYVILINAALLPLMQWWRLTGRGHSPKWYSPKFTTFMFALILYCAALTFGVRYWTIYLSALGPAAELLLLALLIPLSQWFYRRRVMRHYLTADLA